VSEIYRAPVDPTIDNNPHSIALRMIGSRERVLEVGCSVGHVTRQLVAAGNSVVGVEVDPGAAAEAAQWATVMHVVDLDTSRLSRIESGPFDVIYLGDVLEHLRTPSPVLADLLTTLTPEGRVVISVPNIAFVDLRLMLLEGTWAYQDHGILDRTHLHWFTKESLRELLDDVGLAATRLSRVRKPTFGTIAPVDRRLHSPEVIRFIEADPEALTFQYVVEARRAGRPEIPDDDPLAAIPVRWPDLGAERQALEAEVDRCRAEASELRAELDAVGRSWMGRRALAAARRRPGER
jgi:2-polyprenyl-3-methyl-5-hydroxy-6-metoxy-1,4-benzoquinol methylase